MEPSCMYNVVVFSFCWALVEEYIIVMFFDLLNFCID